MTMAITQERYESCEYLGKEAYNGYCEVVDYKNYQGLPVPNWENLTDKIRTAWVVSAIHAVHCAVNKAIPTE